MRYYDISIDGGPRWTSHPKGPGQPPDPGALQVEMDINNVAYGTAVTGDTVTIWGIPLQQISQAFDLNRKNVTIRGGMGVGLPLATAQSKNAGILVRATVNQAFGNWIGTNMYLTLVFTGAPQTATGIAGAETPDKLVVNWRAGQEMADTLHSTLSAAFPDYTLDVRIKKGLVLGYDQPGYYSTLWQLAQYTKSASKDIMGPGYNGVDISVHDKTIRVDDGSTGGTAKQIAFTDLIGQPTWLAPTMISVTTVMRADLHVGDWITLPNTLVTIAPKSSSEFNAIQSFSTARQNSIFQGQFRVFGIRHVGNFRSPDGAQWITVLSCSATGQLLGTPADQIQIAPLQPTGLGGKNPPFN